MCDLLFPCSSLVRLVEPGCRDTGGELSLSDSVGPREGCRSTGSHVEAFGRESAVTRSHCTAGAVFFGAVALPVSGVAHLLRAVVVCSKYQSWIAGTEKWLLPGTKQLL